MARSNRTG
ncbi:ahpC/TSA family protein, partial [Vibrio parahaemolyticus VPTS-2010]